MDQSGWGRQSPRITASAQVRSRYIPTSMNRIMWWWWMRACSTALMWRRGWIPRALSLLIPRAARRRLRSICTAIREQFTQSMRRRFPWERLGRIIPIRRCLQRQWRCQRLWSERSFSRRWRRLSSISLQRSRKWLMAIWWR